MSWPSARSWAVAAAGLACALLLASCGGATPTSPAPKPPPSDGVPPQNALPSIDSISVQGRRIRQPAAFADLGETVDVTAQVRDAETPVEELSFVWTATTGTFDGSGRNVTWKAPDVLDRTPTQIVISVKVTEKFGYPGQAKVFSQDVSSSLTVSLHDSKKEVGDMARQFLLDFSDTNIKDWQQIMRNFNAAACPTPSEVDSEKSDVINNYTNFDMLDFRIGAPRVTINFGGTCEFRGKRGDACAVVPSYWDSRKKSSGVRSSVDGDDIIAAAYSNKDARWWLCASDYRVVGTVAPSHASYAR